MASINFPNIPEVVLASIFTFFCGDEPVLLPRRTTDRRGILSSVNERWKSVLQSTATLWNHILFTTPPSSILLANVLLHEFYMCTARNGSNLLTVAFDMGPHDWQISIVHAVVIPNVGRIRNLTCPIHTDMDISAFLKIPEGQLSALESIEVAFVNTWTEPISKFSLDSCLEFNALKMVPHLRAVTIHLFNGLHPVDLHLPWDHLTFIDLASAAMTPEIFVKIIRYGAQRLEEGYFQVQFSRLVCPQRVLSHTNITMNNLKILRLRLIYPNSDARLFSIIRFPVLHSLSIYMFDTRQHWDVSPYIGLLQASKHTLRQLHLSDFSPPGLRIFRTAQNVQGHPPVNRQHRYTTHHTLEELFKIIPNVESLTLPLGLPVHVVTAEKLAACDLLPKARILELGATIDSAEHMLYVLQRRHEYISLGVESSVIVDRPSATSQQTIIRSLDLWVPDHQYTSNMASVLGQHTQLLASLGIFVIIHPTPDLPLPIQ